MPVEDILEALRENSIEGLIRVYPDGGHAIKDSLKGSVQREFLLDLVEFIGEP